MKRLLPTLLVTVACSSPMTQQHPTDGSGGGSADGSNNRQPDSGTQPTSNVSIIVEPNGASGAELVTAINGAQHSVYMTMYQIDNTAVINALVSRKQAGLDVQAILDSSSQSKSWNTPAYNTLSSAGVNVVWSSSSFTYTHEKTVIIDGQTAWIMTMNANTSSPRYNREYLAIDTTASDVAEATAIFQADHANHSITPSGALVVANSNARADLVALIDSAQHTVDIEDEELSDTHSNGIVDAIVQARSHGVAVRVVLANGSGDSTQASAVSQIKAAGGQVVVTGPTSSNGTASNPYIHAKAIVVDCVSGTCAKAFVGSENLTAGSLGYNRELGVIFAEPSEVSKVESSIASDFQRGTPQ
jgi:phosphatidylserine/phosphatidylglycerophosphate/cardiolipin synthase-like enzyme